MPRGLLGSSLGILFGLFLGFSFGGETANETAKASHLSSSLGILFDLFLGLFLTRTEAAKASEAKSGRLVRRVVLKDLEGQVPVEEVLPRLVEVIHLGPAVSLGTPLVEQLLGLGLVR